MVLMLKISCFANILNYIHCRLDGLAKPALNMVLYIGLLYQIGPSEL